MQGDPLLSAISLESRNGSRQRSCRIAPPADTDLELPPFAPARGPSTDWGELVQEHDDRYAVQASPDELPAIDILRLWPVPDARPDLAAQGAPVSRKTVVEAPLTGLFFDRGYLVLEYEEEEDPLVAIPPNPGCCSS